MHIVQADMGTDKKYAINLTLFKIIGFYQLVDPKSPKMFGYNRFQLINIVLVVISSTITLIGLSGYITKTDDNIDYGFKNMQMLFYIACITVGNLKLIIVMYNASTIWKLFDVPHKSFLSSKHSQKNFYKLVNCGKVYARIFPWYFFLFFMTAFSWSITPMILNSNVFSKETNSNNNIHKANVVNLRYPISKNTYNTFFNVLYVMEGMLSSYSAFGLVTFDLFLIALLKILCTQYEVVSCAYKSLEFRDEEENGKKLSYKEVEEEFILITKDCQNIYKQLEIVYRISRPITLIYMVGDALGMITMPYLIVMCYVQNGSIFNTDIITFLWTFCVVGTQSFMFCSLFQLVNERKESVNFGLYSCDWTWLELRFKKLLLLTMRINSSNNLKMHVTQNKLIDLPMLATIVRLSYNITSVMINSNIHKLQK